MNSQRPRSGFRRKALYGVIAIVCVASLQWNSPLLLAQEETTTTEEAPKIPNDQLDSLVAPIALYPDAMLAQTLAASTYPLEVMQLDQWMDKNKNLKDKALADAVAKQPWDPSVQSMAAFPDVVQRMAENIQWMTDVGNAVLAQQKDVMDAVQRLRAKAQGTGNLKTGSEQKVETKTTQSGQQVIVVEQANPEAAYVPSYDPEVVYGAAPAEYPYYPYSYPGYQPGTALAWGSAIAVGGVWANNNWGNCDWDDGNVTINNNNNFNKNYNKNVNKTGTGQGNGWQHNPQHRGNAPYANKQTANKYGGKTAGGAGKPGGPGGAGGVGGAGKPGGPGGAGGVGGAGKPGGPGGAGGAGSAGKPGGPAGAGGAGSAGKPGGPGGAGGAGKATGAGAGKATSGGAGKPSGGSAAKASGGGGKGGADKVGGHKPSSGGGGGGAFAGGSGSSAKAASSRGGSSMKGGGGGGGGKKGGGGGGRGGGGGGGKKGGGGGRGR
jgi:Protein of unknown function (DUF3300)